MITLPQLCKLSESGKPAESVRDFIASYAEKFNFILQYHTPAERLKYCEKVMGGASIKELYKSYPALVQIFVQHLLSGSSFEAAPSIFDDFAFCLAEEMSCIPDILLQSPDLADAEDKTRYQSMPKEPSVCYVRVGYESEKHNAKIEGYWRKANKERPSDLDKKQSFTAENIMQAQKLILLRDRPTETYQHPVPESASWKNQEALINCLQAFQHIAEINERMPSLRTILRSRIPMDIFDKLLISDVHHAVFDINHFELLPVASKDDKACVVKLNDGDVLVWTHVLLDYIKAYNVIPAKEFLQKFKSLLHRCQTTYRDAANELSKYLAKHDVTPHHVSSGEKAAAPLLENGLFRPVPK